MATQRATVGDTARGASGRVASELHEAVESVVVSGGFGRLHLALTAREASDRKLLRVAIVGAYPTTRLKRTLRSLRLADKGRVARLLERDEGIPEEKLRAHLVTELLFEFIHLIRRVPILGVLHSILHKPVLRLYGRLASRQLTSDGAGARIFHFLAAYGQASIDRAHELGMLALCDHAIVHPSVIDPLVNGRGRLALDAGGRPRLARPRDPHWQAKLDDLARSDAVLVNSDFVKDTFITAGWPPDRVHVAYLGVDEAFAQELSPVLRTADDGPLRLLFAGRVEPRKGVEVLFEALAELRDIEWELTLAGPVDAAIKERHRRFLADPRTAQLGTVRRPRLRDLMLSTPVFVFPSYAEGSARVIFEALACGCYVITTPNAGSIVEDGVHGTIVSPGDVAGLTHALRMAASERKMVADAGTKNSNLVLTQFRQSHYGERLSQIYRELAQSASAHGSAA